MYPADWSSHQLLPSVVRSSLELRYLCELLLLLAAFHIPPWTLFRRRLKVLFHELYVEAESGTKYLTSV